MILSGFADMAVAQVAEIRKAAVKSTTGIIYAPPKYD
jgi:hypothetical protein